MVNHSDCDHDHSHSKHHSHAESHSPGGAPDRALRAVIGFTAAFMVVEWAAGYWANSLALMTDAAHMLTDVGAMSMGLVGAWLSRRPSNARMTFGYRRAEILFALANGLLIWFLAGVLVFEAIQRFQAPEPVRGWAVVWVSCAGLAVNLFSMRMLHGHHEESLNMKAVYFHVFGDLLGSVAALVSGIVLLTLGWVWVDPLMTLLVAGLVLMSSWRLVWDAIGVLMESTPPGIEAEKVRDSLKNLRGVEAVHDLHIWAVSTGQPALSVHLISKESEEVLSSAHEVLHREFGIHHTTIQVEHPDRFRSECCFDCGSI